MLGVARTSGLQCRDALSIRVCVCVCVCVLGVARTSGLQCRDALSLTSTSRCSYRGRNRIINPHLHSVSKLIHTLKALHKTCVIILLDAGN